jgi:uncharacterized protein with PQ loop repeat
VSLGYCLKEKKTCVRWVEIYFDDCLCNLNDDVSFALGIASLLCWGVAEIPQVITNFRTKSSNGVSLSFLLAWVAGDIFNLVGCLLEPATLPTQFYTALVTSPSSRRINKHMSLQSLRVASIKISVNCSDLFILFDRFILFYLQISPVTIFFSSLYSFTQ